MSGSPRTAWSRSTTVTTLADRLRAAAPDGSIDAFLDFFGGGYVEWR